MPLDELGGLLNPQPRAEVDTEAGLLIDDVQLQGDDQQLADLTIQPSGLRAIRTDISLNMGQYAGRASSRAALFDEGGINGFLNGSSSSSSDEQESPGSQQQQAAPRQLFTEVVGVRALTPGTLLYQVTPPVDITAYPTMFVNGHINHGPGPNDPTTSSSSSYGTDSSSGEEQPDTAAGSAVPIGNERSQHALELQLEQQHQHPHQQLPQAQVDLLTGQQHQLLHQQQQQQQGEQAAHSSEAVAAAPSPGGDPALLQRQQQQPLASEGSSSGEDSSNEEGSSSGSEQEKGGGSGNPHVAGSTEAAAAAFHTSATAVAVQQHLSAAATGEELTNCAAIEGRSRPVGSQRNAAVVGEQPSEADQRCHLDRAGGASPPDSQPADEQLHSRPRRGKQHAAVVAAADGAGAAADVVAGMSAMLGDDEGMLQLEREAVAVRAEAAQQLLEAAERGSKDASKAAGVRAQKRLWGSALETRIRLQRVVTGANILPRPQQQAALAAADPQIAARYSDVLRSCQAVLEDMLALHGALAQQHPAAAAAAAAASQAAQQQQQQASKAGGIKRRRAKETDLQACVSPHGNDQTPAAAAAGPKGYEDTCLNAGSAWAAVDGAISSLAGFRDASLDKWHRRTVLSSGTAALRGSSGLRVLQQSVSNQVSALMRDKQKLINRTQLPRQLAPRPLGQPPAAAEQAEDDAGDAGAGSNGHSKGRDVDTFDEGDFYHQLLKELIESAPLGSWPADHLAARPAKRRKVVDRRASKGRKIRYHTMEKLVNFMAPAELVPPPFAEQLFANLFSHEGE